MILIGDSGSTKTDWALVDRSGSVLEIKTEGTNPFFQTEDQICSVIEQSLLPQLTRDVKLSEIHFYGAGCGFEDKILMVRKALGKYLTVSGEICVSTDMLAAARALCKHSEGIACILGTGSNSCHYDGKEIVKNVSPLGFILGDEGSGAVLGKLFIGNILKNQFPEHLKAEFLDEYAITPADIIDKVYRQPFPNRYLAAFSPFILKHLYVPDVRSMVYKSFVDFITRNVCQYKLDLPVHFVGSVAYYYQDILREVLGQHRFETGIILKSPMQGLIEFHQQ